MKTAWYFTDRSVHWWGMKELIQLGEQQMLLEMTGMSKNAGLAYQTPL